MSCKKGTYLVRGQKSSCLSAPWSLSVHVPASAHRIQVEHRNTKVWSLVLWFSITESIYLDPI